MESTLRDCARLMVRMSKISWTCATQARQALGCTQSADAILGKVPSEQHAESVFDFSFFFFLNTLIFPPTTFFSCITVFPTLK